MLSIFTTPSRVGPPLRPSHRAPLCREASEEGEYEEAFWLCAESSKALLEIRDLRVAAHLAVVIDEAHAEATVGLQLALQSVCSGFRAERYAKVRAFHSCLQVTGKDAASLACRLTETFPVQATCRHRLLSPIYNWPVRL